MERKWDVLPDARDWEIARLQKDAERLQKRLNDYENGWGEPATINALRADNGRLREAVQERDGVIERVLLRELRLREALQEIAALPDVRSDEAALIARKALAYPCNPPPSSAAPLLPEPPGE